MIRTFKTVRDGQHCTMPVKPTKLIFIVQLLIEYREAALDSKDDDGRTPLFHCFWYTRRGGRGSVIARKWLQHKQQQGLQWALHLFFGLPVSASTIPTHVSCCNTEPLSLTRYDGKALEVLLGHGANPRIRDNKGKLPLGVVCAREMDSWDWAGNRHYIHVLFQRMIGDASSYKKAETTCVERVSCYGDEAYIRRNSKRSHRRGGCAGKQLLGTVTAFHSGEDSPFTR